MKLAVSNIAWPREQDAATDETRREARVRPEDLEGGRGRRELGDGGGRQRACRQGRAPKVAWGEPPLYVHFCTKGRPHRRGEAGPYTKRRHWGGDNHSILRSDLRSSRGRHHRPERPVHRAITLLFVVAELGRINIASAIINVGKKPTCQ